MRRRKGATRRRRRTHEPQSGVGYSSNDSPRPAANLWEETAWAGVMQTRLERRHNIFVAAVLTAIPFGFIHLPLAFLSEITIASVLISWAPYIVLGLFLRPLVGVVLSQSPACQRTAASRSR